MDQWTGLVEWSDMDLEHTQALQWHDPKAKRSDLYHAPFWRWWAFSASNYSGVPFNDQSQARSCVRFMIMAFSIVRRSFATIWFSGSRLWFVYASWLDTRKYCTTTSLHNTMKSAMRYSRKSERWKSKSTESGKLWAMIEKSVILTTIRITSTVTLMFTRTFVTEAQPLNR